MLLAPALTLSIRQHRQTLHNIRRNVNSVAWMKKTFPEREKEGNGMPLCCKHALLRRNIPLHAAQCTCCVSTVRFPQGSGYTGRASRRICSRSGNGNEKGRARRPSFADRLLPDTGCRHRLIEIVDVVAGRSAEKILPHVLPPDALNKSRDHSRRVLRRGADRKGITRALRETGEQS